MPGLFTSLSPLLLAPALAAAYPVTMGQSVEPGARTSPENEIVDADEDSARRLTVPVSIEGNGPFSFVIDTGSERTVVSNRVAKKLSLEAEEQAQVVSIAGNKMVDTVYVPELTLGKKTYGGLITPVLNRHHIGADGILGLDSLQGQRIVFNFKNNQLDIEDASTEYRRSSSREIVVTAKRLSGQLIFTNAKIAGIDVNLVIDTGSQISIGNLALYDRIQRRSQALGDDSILTAVTGQTLGVDIAYVKDLHLGRIKVPRLPIAFADAPPFFSLGLDRKPAMLLGMDILREFDSVAIDFESRKVHFLTPRAARRPGDLSRAGVTIK